MIAECIGDLKAERVRTMQPKVGVMIEVPSAVESGRLAAAADFVSIGSNDLVQYSSPSIGERYISDLYLCHHPAVLAPSNVADPHGLNKPFSPARGGMISRCRTAGDRHQDLERRSPSDTDAASSDIGAASTKPDRQRPSADESNKASRRPASERIDRGITREVPGQWP